MPKIKAITEINMTPNKLAILMSEEIPNLPIKNAIALNEAIGLSHINSVKILKKKFCATSSGFKMRGLCLPPNAEMRMAKTSAMDSTCKVFSLM